MENKQDYKTVPAEREKEAAYFKARKAEAEKSINNEVLRIERLEQSYREEER